MKKLIFSITLIGSCMICSPIFSQSQIKDSLGLPGDNFNLYGVLDLFQQSKTLEEFERKLNAQDSKLNNLDLNNDNKIDYLKIVDNVQGTSHAIVIKDEISDKDLQDVAVIEVDKDKNGKVKIQIVGDELLYGKNYIVEPKELEEKSNTAGETANPGYKDQITVINNTTNNYYNNDNSYPGNYYGGGGVYYPVNNWYMWDYLYGPTYVVYVSPWYWGYYPGYWNPWTPWYWHEYYGFHYQHYGYYHRCYTYRAPEAHGYYGQRKSVSTTVNNRIASGNYRSTYGRRDLLHKTMDENRAVKENNNRLNKPNQDNNNRRQKDVQPRNDNRVNDNRVNDNQRGNNSPQNNNVPRNNTRENKPERNNNQQAKPNRQERKAERIQQRQSQPSRPQQQSAPKQNNPGGGKRR